jgi:hypothetical protein
LIFPSKVIYDEKFGTQEPIKEIFSYQWNLSTTGGNLWSKIQTQNPFQKPESVTNLILINLFFGCQFSVQQFVTKELQWKDHKNPFFKLQIELNEMNVEWNKYWIFSFIILWQKMDSLMFDNKCLLFQFPKELRYYWHYFLIFKQTKKGFLTWTLLTFRILSIDEIYPPMSNPIFILRVGKNQKSVQVS